MIKKIWKFLTGDISESLESISNQNEQIWSVAQSNKATLEQLKGDIRKMDENTQNAIQAVRDAVTNGSAALAQTISDEATDIKNKFDDVIKNLPPQTDPAIAQQLNDLATSVTNSFSTLSDGVKNLSDNVSTTTAPPADSNTGETPVT